MLKLEGLDKLQKKLNTLSKNAEELDGQHSIPVAELLTTAFVSKHTKFSDAEKLFEGSGFNIENSEDFEAIPEDKWDDYIRSNSNFDSWEAMLSLATQEWAVKKLGL